MAKLRHVAIASEDPGKTAAILRTTFELEQVGEIDSDLAHGVFLSDGTVNLAVLNFHSDQIGKGADYQGLHHIGFLVEDIDPVKEDLTGQGAVLLFDTPDDPGAAFFEVKLRLPGDLVLDIADRPWVGARA